MPCRWTGSRRHEEAPWVVRRARIPRALRSVFAAGAIALLTAAGARAQGWAEQGDAPDLMPGQPTAGSGALHLIEGTLGGLHDVDLFQIQVLDPVLFRASTVDAVSPSFDTQLFLFDAGGHGVTHSDDAEGTPQSTLTRAFVQPLGPGAYVVAISCRDRDAASPSGHAIWKDVPASLERAPDGPGAGQPLGQWQESGLQALPYCILLEGAAFAPSCTPPLVLECPVWQRVVEGGTATFSVTATGTPPLAHQWFDSSGPIAGATAPKLVISNAGSADAGPYWVTVTNPCGSIQC